MPIGFEPERAVARYIDLPFLKAAGLK